MPDPDYLMALRVTAGHAYACSCSECEIVRREDAKPRQTPPPGVMPDHRQSEGCVCGHGAYNHGGGHTAIGRLMGEHSRCIRCSCMEFRRKEASK